jgi:hypothetical protein
MTITWQEELICATQCARCNIKLAAVDLRILSVYDHEAVCMDCKRAEESRPDFQEVSMQVAEQCLIHSESGKGDPKGYCYHHFYPYKCE